MKSMNIRLITGRNPCEAAPIASPAMAFSEIGVSMIRSGPNFVRMPCVNPKTSPRSARSMPAMKTVGSRSTASWSASFTAWR